MKTTKIDSSRLANPVYQSTDNLRDPSVFPVDGGYHVFYSRLSGPDWADPKNWTVSAAYTSDFQLYADQRDITGAGFASPGDLVHWHGRYILPYQSYPVHPCRLCFSESTDLRNWSEPTFFLDEALGLPWNDAGRLIDPSFVIDGDVLHCWFVGTSNTPNRANLLGHAVTRDPLLRDWRILSVDKPLLGRSERATDGVENVAVYRTGTQWTMIFSEGLAAQHLAVAASADLYSWTVLGALKIPSQAWMAYKHGAPFVWKEEDRWWMMLMGESAQRRTSFGLLYSKDGLSWTSLPEKL
jgi:sucrose-6-phosphate hydrolase SacC (GH32 family)